MSLLQRGHLAGDSWALGTMAQAPLTCGADDQAVLDAIAASHKVDVMGGEATTERALEVARCVRARRERDQAGQQTIDDYVSERAERLTVLRITWLYLALVVLAMPAYGAWRYGRTRPTAFMWGALAGAMVSTLWEYSPTAEHVLDYRC